jgi:hypothetical protein
MRPAPRSAASALSAIALVAAMASPAAADLITIGTGNVGANTFPLGSPDGENFPYLGEYQQIYAAPEFSAPVTITGVAFQTVRPPRATVSDDITVGLSTTAATLDAPGATYAARIGADFTTVFAGTLAITARSDGTFDVFIPLSPFRYDPANGNLLLDVDVLSSTGPGIVAFATTVDHVTTRIFNFGGTGTPTIDVGFGLLTQFTVGAVPEPSSLALCGLGIVAAAAYAHGRRKARS